MKPTPSVRTAAAGSAAAGYTLLETLVALSLVALLIGAVLQSMRWVTVVSSFGNRAAQVTAIEAGANALTDLLAAAVLTTQSAPRFIGDERSFAFDMVSDGVVTPPGHVRVTVRARPAGEGRIDLAASFAPAAGDGSSATTALFENLTAVRVQYFGQDDGGSPRSWRGSWTNPSVLPALLLLEIESDVGGAVLRLPLYARVGRQSGIFAGRI
jgi:type II secretory pathway pseudopilin PulG